MLSCNWQVTVFIISQGIPPSHGSQFLCPLTDTDVEPYNLNYELSCWEHSYSNFLGYVFIFCKCLEVK